MLKCTYILILRELIFNECNNFMEAKTSDLPSVKLTVTNRGFWDCPEMRL